MQAGIAGGRAALALEGLEDVPAPLAVNGVLGLAPQVEERLDRLGPPDVVRVADLQVLPLVKVVVLAAQLAGLALVKLVARAPDLGGEEIPI